MTHWRCDLCCTCYTVHLLSKKALWPHILVPGSSARCSLHGVGSQVPPGPRGGSKGPHVISEIPPKCRHPGAGPHVNGQLGDIQPSHGSLAATKIGSESQDWKQSLRPWPLKEEQSAPAKVKMMPTFGPKILGMPGENLRSSFKQRIRDIRVRFGRLKPTEGSRKESLKRAASSDYEDVFSSKISVVLAHWDQRPPTEVESPAKRPRRDKQRTFPITNPRMMLNRGSQVAGLSGPRVKRDGQKVLSGIATSPGFKIYEDYEDFQSSGQGFKDFTCTSVSIGQTPPPPLPPRKSQYCLPPPLPRDRLGSSSVRQAHLVLRREALLRNLENEETTAEPVVVKRETFFSDLDHNGRQEPIVLRREAILRNLEQNRLRRLHQMAKYTGHGILWETPASAWNCRKEYNLTWK